MTLWEVQEAYERGQVGEGRGWQVGKTSRKC